MTELQPPLLEMSFFFGATPETIAYGALVRTLIEMKAELTGEGLAFRFVGAGNTDFGSIHEYELEPVVIGTLSDFKHLAEDQNTRVLQVRMKGASGIKTESNEIVGYVSISGSAAGKDRHPLSIATDGNFMCSPFRERYPERSRTLGREVYNRFVQLLRALEPAYAAITFEYPLECPSDLRRDPRSLAFRDFYVSATCLGRENLDRVKQLFHGAYVEPVKDGVYVSSFEYLNPLGKSLDPTAAQWKSVDVAKMITTTEC